MKVRNVVAGDIEEIVRVETETFGTVGESAVAPREMMEKRIDKCGNGWFLVAEDGGCLVGYILLQPTHLAPDQCTSWDAATDGGTLERTFDENGGNIYVVSLAASEKVPGASDFLAFAAFVRWLERGKKFFIFCSRMPGFANMSAKKGIRPDEYWQLKRDDGSPTDWMLHLYWEMTGGAQPVRLLRDGFPPDTESGGHGVLFAAEDPVAALHAVSQMIFHAGFVAGKKSRKGGQQ